MRALVMNAATAVLATAVVAAQAQQGTTFKSNVNMLAVDALVVDRQGSPILGLLPDDFTVSVNGKTRHVASATLVKYASEAPPNIAAEITTPISLASLKTPGRVPDDGRTFVIAVDEPSFLTSDMRAAVRAAQRFVLNTRPEDMVGAYMFPFSTPLLDLTHDHGAVVTKLDRAIGRRVSTSSRYHLTTDEIIEISAGSQDPLDEAWRRECPTLPGQPPDLGCLASIRAEAMSIGAFAESEAAQRVYGLGELIESLQHVPGHKTLLLLSGGMLATNRIGGRPDVRSYMKRLGEQAARANVMMYVLHIDTSFEQLFSAARPLTPDPAGRIRSSFSDGAMFSAGLETLASEAGGAYLPVKAGTGENVFGRVLRETMAYYLLGVEPTPDDWDGRKLMVKVKTTAKGATVRAVREIIAR